MEEMLRQHEQQKGRTHQRSYTPEGSQAQYDHEVLEVARVVRVVKGGRRFRFRTIVVAGDHMGNVGFGIGKSRDVQESIQHAYEQATKHMIRVPLFKGTIPYEGRAKFKGADVLLRPARPGTGIIAGNAVRIVADMVGIQDIVSKMYGSSNKISNVCATLKILGQMKAKTKT